MYCLPKFASDDLLKSLKDGTINPEKLIAMTSAERRDFFGTIVGESNATQVNALFESKLLLKNQQQGIINWAKQITGIKPEIQRDILSRVNKMTDILQPKELEMFLEDIAAKRLGFGVSAEEAGKIVELSKAVNDAKEAMSNGGDRLVYGKAKVDFNNYVESLKHDAQKQSLKQNVKEVFTKPAKSITKLGGQAKSLKASLDNSAIFRQGWKTMFTNPKIWLENSIKSFSDIYNSFGDKPTLDAVKADILSRPNYPLMQKAKLAVGTVEEAFPSSLPEKIPLLGRLYKASENAYTGFVYRMRADIFDKYIDIARKTGVDVTDKSELEAIGQLVNSLTGRGNLGSLEKAGGFVNNVLFSPRFLVSHIEVLTANRVAMGPNSDFAKRQAAKNLLKIIAGTAIILTIAKSLNSDSVDLDPRSADFGKIKIKGTRFDVSGGMSSIITLLSRIGTWSTKSSTTGEISKINSGTYGSQTGIDVLVNFFENKTSPIGSVLRDYLRNEDANGNKPTVLGSVNNLLTPLPIQNIISNLNTPGGAPLLATIIADGLGVATNTYAPSSAGVIADKQGVYQDVLEIMASGKKEDAQKLVDEYNKKLKSVITDDLTKKDTEGDVEKLTEKIDKKYKKEAINLPSPEQVDKYKLNPTDDVVQKVLSNGKPVIVKDTPVNMGGIIGTVINYAHAIGVDPSTAFNDIFTGQKITEVRNGTVIVERMTLEESQKVKTDRGGNNKTMKLDHTLPLELGGNNHEDNLKLVTTATWKSYSPVENYLGKALKAKEIDKKTAQKLIIDFKNKSISFDQIKQQVKSKAK